MGDHLAAKTPRRDLLGVNGLRAYISEFPQGKLIESAFRALAVLEMQITQLCSTSLDDFLTPWFNEAHLECFTGIALMLFARQTFLVALVVAVTRLTMFVANCIIYLNLQDIHLQRSSHALPALIYEQYGIAQGFQKTPSLEKFISMGFGLLALASAVVSVSAQAILIGGLLGNIVWPAVKRWMRVASRDWSDMKVYCLGLLKAACIALTALLSPKLTITVITRLIGAMQFGFGLSMFSRHVSAILAESREASIPRWREIVFTATVLGLSLILSSQVHQRRRLQPGRMDDSMLTDYYGDTLKFMTISEGEGSGGTVSARFFGSLSSKLPDYDSSNFKKLMDSTSPAQEHRQIYEELQQSLNKLYWRLLFSSPMYLLRFWRHLCHIENLQRLHRERDSKLEASGDASMSVPGLCVWLYTSPCMHWYLNEVLESDDLYRMSQLALLSKGIQTFIEENHANTPPPAKLRRVYRGTKQTEMNPYRRNKPGDIITFPRFTSTSMTPGVAQNFAWPAKEGVILVINMPNSTRTAASLVNHTWFNWEKEILIKPWARYRVREWGVQGEKWEETRPPENYRLVLYLDLLD